jgi:hypothetical protein
MSLLDEALDSNFGCLELELENKFQQQLKKIRRVDCFKDYYNWVGVPCPDAQALQLRLRQAIDNSKEKKYHGSSEHMNYLPPL